MKLVIILLLLLTSCSDVICAEKQDITSKFKDAINKLGDKLQDKVDDISGMLTKNKKHAHKTHNQVVKKKNIPKNDTLIIKKYIYQPIPDIEIFEPNTVDITKGLPNIIVENDQYFVENISINEDAGASVGESMEIAYKKVINIAFSSIIKQADKTHLYFSMQDALFCLNSVFASSEYFDENRYSAKFIVVFSKVKFDATVNKIVLNLFLKGKDENGNDLKDILTYVRFQEKKEWYNIESRLEKADLKYIILGLQSDQSLVKIVKTNTNLADALDLLDLKLVIDNKKPHIVLK